MPYVMKLNHPDGTFLYVHGPEPWCRCTYPGIAMRMNTINEWRAWWCLHQKSITGEPQM